MTTVITDSTADLSPELLERFNIKVVPLLVNFNSQTYLDGVDINLEKLFSLVQETGQLPKTAAPPVAVLLDAFNCDDDVIYIGLSSRLSATFQNATLAAQQLETGKVRLIDSLNLSTGIGMQILRAAELRDQGMACDDIAKTVQASVSKVRTSFVIDTMEYLYKGGRCSALQNLVGSLLHIRPVIEVRRDGTMGVKDKIRGSRKKALDSMLVDLENNLDQLDRHRVFVTHCVCEEDARYLAGEVKRIASPDEVCITSAGSVIASHCGPNCIGILYYLK